MQYTIPHYYKKFRCLAGSCPSTCCAGWQIQIDPVSLARYSFAKGPLGSRLKNEIIWSEKRFRQYGGRCAFLNDDNLCDLYLEGGGEKAFCRTCRTYPRHIEEFEGLREISLSLSCPAAADLILDSQEKVRFLHIEKPGKHETYPKFDFLLFTKLMDARALIIKILQEREHPMRVRLAAALALAHDLQERIDHNALFDADSLFERYSSPRLWPWFEDRLDELRHKKVQRQYAVKREETIGNLFIILNQLEVLSPDWRPYLRESRAVLSENTVCASTDPSMPEGQQTQSPLSFTEVFPDTAMEQLMVYFVFTYFCGAVYSRNAYGKMKFSFAGAVLIRELTRARWLLDRSVRDQHNISVGDTHDLPDSRSGCLKDAACRYAREVEHSDFNKYKMEKLLDNENRFSLENLLSVL